MTENNRRSGKSGVDWALGCQLRLFQKCFIVSLVLHFESKYAVRTPKSPEGDFQSLLFRGGLEG